MIKYKHMITGLLRIIDGTIMFISLGHIKSRLSITWLSYILNKRKP